MIRGMRWRGVGTLAVGVVAGTIVAGFPQAVTGPPAASPPAESLLGELSTIDPCSLTNPAVFSSFGTAKIDTPTSIYECIVDIATPAGAAGILWVGALDRAESHPNFADKEVRNLPGGLNVVEYEAGTNYCTHLLVFPDAITLSVRYRIAFGDDKPNECDVVAAAMDTVVEVVRGGGVRHRTFPPGSLGPVDPCAVTPAHMPAAVPQLRAVKPISRPDKHACTWSTADTTTRVGVEFRAGARKRNLIQGAERTIAGRASVVERQTAVGREICKVETRPVPFAADGQPDLVEVASVHVEIPDGQRPWACQLAADIATAVWPKLPSP